MASKELVSDYSRLRTYYMHVAEKYQKEPVNLPQCQDLPDSTDYLYPDEVEALEVCDNDPDLDIRTGYRVYAKNGLELNSEYSALLDTYFRAGEYRHLYVVYILQFQLSSEENRKFFFSIRVARS